MNMPDADPCLYKLSPTRTYPLLHLRMRVASALLGLTPRGSLCSWIVVDKHHPPIDLDHQDLSIRFRWTLSGGT
jgi:hypothetical protein